MHPGINCSIKSSKIGELTDHAWKRMCGRSFSPGDISSVIKYGRAVYARGAQIHAVGRKEVRQYKKAGVDLSNAEGIHVVCCPENKSIITAYRNHNFRSLKPKKRGQKAK